MPKRKVCCLNSTLRFFRDCILGMLSQLNTTFLSWLHTAFRGSPRGQVASRNIIQIKERFVKDWVIWWLTFDTKVRHKKYWRLALEGQSGESARVFVQVKRENGTKKGLSFWVWVPFYDLSFWILIVVEHTMGREVSSCHFSKRCRESRHWKLAGCHPWSSGCPRIFFCCWRFLSCGFRVEPNFLIGDPDEPTELFYKGLATSSKKKGIAGIKFVQPAQENWFMVIKTRRCWQIWHLGSWGDEITRWSVSQSLKTVLTDGDTVYACEESHKEEEGTSHPYTIHCTWCFPLHCCERLTYARIGAPQKSVSKTYRYNSEYYTWRQLSIFRLQCIYGVRTTLFNIFGTTQSV